MAVFHFELVSPDKAQFNGPAQSVLAPGSDGDFLVLRDHAPVMTALRPGVVVIEDEGGKTSRYFVRGGFVDVNSGGCILLAETAIPAEDVSAADLDQDIKNAEEDLADASEENKPRAQEKLDHLREVKETMKL
ncbi:MAG TPA: F0F1 ATP synthase subunit epsilon [Roseiarcus sp.]|nr:F0F1 ATP synthase subunit epsilon [Roseiarcus sp.]